MSTDLTQSLGAFVRSASGKTTRSSSPMEFWTGLSGLIVDNIADNWEATTKAYQAGRQEHYFSAEFLMGRAMLNNLTNHRYAPYGQMPGTERSINLFVTKKF